MIKRSVKEEIAKELSEKAGISEKDAQEIVNKLAHHLESKFVDLLATNEKFLNKIANNEKFLEFVAKKLDFNLTRRLILATGALCALTLGTGTAGAKLVLTDKFVELDGQRFYPAPVGAYDVIVMKDDANVWAEDRFGKVIAEGVSGEDDAEVIQKAINHSAGIIYISKGVYIINKTIYVDSYRIIRGGYTILKLADNANCDIFRNVNFDKGWEVVHIEISDIHLEGNKANNTSGSGINIQVYQSKFKNLRIYNFRSHGIRIDFKTGEDNIIQDCIIGYCGVGIGVYYGATEIFNNILLGCGKGIFVGGWNKKIVNNYLYGCNTSILSDNARWVIISNNKIDAPGDGIVIYPTKCPGYYPEATIISNNYIWGFNKGILLHGSNDYKIDNVLITNNIIEYGRNEDRTGWAEAFISLVHTRNNIVQFNKFIRTGSGYIRYLYLSDSRDIIRFNFGYTTENKGVTYVTGDGTTQTFTVDITHGLVSDKLTARITLDRDGTVDKVYLVDKDGDGFKETIRVQVTFATAPADGEQVPIYWYAEVVQ